MKRLFIGLAATAMMATAAQAVTVTGTFGAPDPGPAAGQSIVVSFDGPNAAGYSWSGGIATSCTSIAGAAMPAVGPGGTASCFGYVSSAINPNNATLSTPDLKSISFYWGSIDTYNQVDVLGAGGATIFSIGGASLPPSNGNQGLPSTNRRVNFIADAGQVITGLKFTSTGVAFEFDSFAAEGAITTGGGVPEPATWAMLLAGFGMVGVSARRRRPTVAA
ncbi:Npun_F0296 family exosortase-dependent surface protein [Sandarakinorhabdus oryzae]|uniref:Npun_F0296 family exosortase-dependent surface protein n=1 Tax=Sandarakinorhabdus oryzae TaxID=2675220 RepID=UPI0012E1F77E|nr:PEPxxWA-CTERM sorting domain-containing protein [Sandarakinorhabdus oryzae]